MKIPLKQYLSLKNKTFPFENRKLSINVFNVGWDLETRKFK